jgi:FAD/FMN-containing dehydrogenase
MSTNGLNELAASFTGSLLEPGDGGYDEARRVHNGMIDRHPAVIARCQGTADIVDAVRFARDRGLEIAVRGGGHNVAGNAVCDGGLMIDLSPMKGMHVEPERRTVRAQGGVTWGELNRETQLHGLAVTGGVVSSTGIAGLTLGGGLGWLMGRFGMVVDNLRSAEVVTANGEVLTASADQNPDLYWALRGGGGNFGVVSSFEYDLHPVGPTVIGGLVAHPIERAREVLDFFRETTSALPDELTVFAGLVHAPDGSGVPLAAILCCHSGPLGQAEADVRPIKEFGPPIMDMIGPMPYSAVNAMLDGGFPKGALNYWKSSFVRDLTSDAIETMVTQFATCPSPMTGMLLEHFHGAATRAGATDTAFPHRAVGYNFLVASEWTDPGETDANVAWTRETFSAMEPQLAKTSYVNYLGEDDGEDRVAASFGPNFERLRTVKRRYDPENVFHLNQNVRP